jgi:hypothetical protein
MTDNAHIAEAMAGNVASSSKLEERASELEHRAQARQFATEHEALDLPLSDAFRNTLVREIADGDISPDAAAVQYQEQIIEEVFAEQAEDAN